MTQFIDYLKETQEEVKRVSWPTRKQAIVYTALVVGISVVIGLYAGIFDFVFSRALDWFIR